MVAAGDQPLDLQSYYVTVLHIRSIVVALDVWDSYRVYLSKGNCTGEDPLRRKVRLHMFGIEPAHSGTSSDSIAVKEIVSRIRITFILSLH